MVDSSRGSKSSDLISGSGLPPHEAVRILMAVTGSDRIRLVTGTAVPVVATDRFHLLVQRRLAGEPLQYLETTAPFGPLDLKVDPRGLIPRPETEQLWELVIREVEEPPRVVVDLCTGSGNLALACKLTWPDARVLATDLSAGAVDLARENSELTGHRIEVLAGDLFEPLPTDIMGAVDLIVANPPYLAESELATLPDDVRLHEPEMALVAGPTGMEVLRHIADDADAWLRPGGLIACEISEFHSTETAGLFLRYDAGVRTDLAGRDRFILGRRRSVPAR